MKQDKKRRNSRGSKDSEHHSERAPQQEDVPYEEREERIEHAEPHRQHHHHRRRKHRASTDKERRNTFDGADVAAAGYAQRHGQKTYQSARDIIDELMDDYDVTARQIVLRLIPELRYLLTDEEDRHAGRSDLGEGKEPQKLTALFRGWSCLGQL